MSWDGTANVGAFGHVLISCPPGMMRVSMTSASLLGVNGISIRPHDPSGKVEWALWTGKQGLVVHVALGNNTPDDAVPSVVMAAEQGLLGSLAYVARHLAGPQNAAAHANLSAYLNDDPGAGPTYGWYMEGNEAAKAIFDAWLEPLRDLGMRRNVIEGIPSTDHEAVGGGARELRLAGGDA